MRRSVSEVETAIRSVLAEYEREILDRSNWIKKNGRWQYKFSISLEEVLRRSGIKSRSTLRATHYRGIRQEIEARIASLKTEGGKKRDIPNTERQYDLQNRNHILEQIIAMQDLEIARLEDALKLAKNVSTLRVKK